MSTATVLAEGKTKILRPGDRADEVRVEYKNAATAFNAKKVAEVPGKGELNAKISTILFQLLEEAGIPTCFRGPGSHPAELIYQKLAMIPLEVVVRNYAYGSIVQRFGFEEGMPFQKPLVEYFYKSSDDPQITEDLIAELQLVPAGTSLDAFKRMALQINELFLGFFEPRGIRVADFKLEFGLDESGRLRLGDELSPDNFRLRDAQTGAVLDKDVFRLDLGDLGEAYRTLLARMQQPAASVRGVATTAYEAEVTVSSRKNILNPESKAIMEGLQSLGYGSVRELRAGKRFAVRIEAPTMVEAERQVARMAENVLSNPVIEDFHYTIRPL